MNSFIIFTRKVLLLDVVIATVFVIFEIDVIDVCVSKRILIRKKGQVGYSIRLVYQVKVSIQI